MSKSSVGALALAHEFIARHVKPGDFCIDATAGRGGDTALLCSLVGERGRVLALDIQREAVDSTLELLQQQGLEAIAEVRLAGHEHLADYAPPGSVDCIVFNFGWLPGGDHSVQTRPETSIQAIRAGLALLRPGAVMSLCIYYGRESGFAERDALLEYLETVDFRRYTVLVNRFVNRPNNPPIAVMITRDE